MRKLGFGFLGLLLVGVIYYFTLGKSQLITEVKQQVDKELIVLQKEGFVVENRKVEKSSDYFELSLHDTQKALAFFKSHGIAVEPSDIEALKGLKLGIRLQYLPDSYTSVALDMIPLTLPTQWTSEAAPSQKEALSALQKLLDKKALAIHVDVNKVGNGFKGYVKDIDEILAVEEKPRIQLQSLTFKGTLEQQKLHTFSQNLKHLNISIPQELNSTLSNLDNTYTNTDKGYINLYNFASFTLQDKGNKLTISDVIMKTTVSSIDKLATIKVENHSKQIDILANKAHYLLEDVNFTSLAKNLDITAFEKLQSIDPEDKEALDRIISQLLSKGVAFSIPNLAVGYITMDKERVKGFDINAHVNVDKNIPIDKLSSHPLFALPYLDAKVKIALSPTLLGIIAQRPEAMLAMIMFQPQDINGKKVYQVELKNGKALLNGKALF